MVKPKGKHQATIVWLHGLGDNGSRFDPFFFCNFLIILMLILVVFGLFLIAIEGRKNLITRSRLKVLVKRALEVQC